MQINDPILPVIDESAGENAHKTSQAYQFNVSGFEFLEKEKIRA
jgi:hypothetical protein